MSIPPKKIEKKPRFISLEGNIGSGKSTILRIIRENFPELVILDEPLADWQKVGKNNDINLLDIYYKDPARWGFTFQIFTFMSRITKWADYSRSEGNEVRVSERSLLSDRFVFASIMRDMCLLNETQHQIYLQYYEFLSKLNQISDLSGMIYIRCPPQTCQERIKSRSRKGEDAIPLDYLTKLHEKHESWLTGELEPELELGLESPDKSNCEILVIDNENCLDTDRIVDSIGKWLQKIQ